MKIFVSPPAEATQSELAEISNFRRTTLRLYLNSLDVRASWATLIKAFSVLICDNEDRKFVISNGYLQMMFEVSCKFTYDFILQI